MGDGAETELCTNCQRQIPAANFTIHSVHCTRNLKVCHKCKEPVPVSDMKKHTAYVPCKQCGERMQACDVSPHQREACPQTGITCNYCDIELARVVMRDHEAYCGSRTERCEECGELVMIKYRKLHEESNHGFLKLDDEPGPQPSWMSQAQPTRKVPVQAAIKPLNIDQPSGARNRESLNGAAMPQSSSERKVSFSNSTFGQTSANTRAPDNQPLLEDEAITDINFKNAQALQEKLMRKNSSKHAGSASSINVVPPNCSGREANAGQTNGRVQKVASKKYPAPQPPAEVAPRATQSRLNTTFIAAPSGESSSNSKPSASFKHTRDVPMYAATLREQKQAEERKRQTEINLMQGLPPALNPAQKLDKLRKLSALQNNELVNEVPRPRNTESGSSSTNGGAFIPMSESDLMNRIQKLYNTATDNSVATVNPVNLNTNNQNKSARVKKCNNREPLEGEDHYYEPIGNPSSSDIPSRNSNSPQQPDRFSEIKNGLHILRKELKKCSSPLEPRRSSDANISDLPRPQVQRQNSDNNNPGAAEGPPRVLRDRNLQDVPHQRLLESDSGRPQQTPRTKKEKNHKKDQQRLRGERRPSDVQVTCEFCYRNMSYVEIQDHEVDCQMKMRREIERRDSRGDDADNAAMLPTNAPFNRPFMDVPADLEGVMLPCEFCHQSIPADMFVTHETGCNPLETSILPPSNSASRRNIDKNFTATPVATKNTNLEHSISQRSNQIQEHSSNRKDRTNLNRQNRTTDHSALGIPQGQHYIGRDRREEINAEGAFGFGDEEVQLPCEFCSSLMPAGMLMVHQEQCGTV